MRTKNKQYCIDKEKVVWRTVDGEAVILNLDDGIYYTLNEVGSRIWEHLAEGKGIEQIADKIAVQFETQSQRVEKDVLGLIVQFKEARLVEVKSAP